MYVNGGWISDKGISRGLAISLIKCECILCWLTNDSYDSKGHRGKPVKRKARDGMICENQRWRYQPAIHKPFGPSVPLTSQPLLASHEEYLGMWTLVDYMYLAVRRGKKKGKGHKGGSVGITITRVNLVEDTYIYMH